MLYKQVFSISLSYIHIIISLYQSVFFAVVKFILVSLNEKELITEY